MKEYKKYLVKWEDDYYSHEDYFQTKQEVKNFIKEKKNSFYFTLVGIFERIELK